MRNDTTKLIGGRAVSILCLFLIFHLCGQVFETRAQAAEIPLIKIGDKFEGEITSGRAKHHRIKVIAGENVRLLISCPGVDLVVDLKDKNNQGIFQFAVPGSHSKPQPISFTVENEGLYELSLRAFGGASPAAVYTIERISGEAVANRIEKLEKAKATLRLAQTQLEFKTLESRQNAVMLFRLATRLFLEAGDEKNASEALLRAKVVSIDIGESNGDQEKDAAPMAIRLPEAGEPVPETMSSVGHDLVFIEPGSFEMGSMEYEDEKPIHRVVIQDGFWLGKYEVTQEQYSMVMGVNPSFFKSCDKCPVDSVSWDDARKFIDKLNQADKEFVYSLPSEAQWEYAAKSGTRGEVNGELNEIAWFTENSKDTTHSVGTKKANSFGLYDMIGNVWEWVEDRYDSRGYARSPTDGSPNVLNGNAKLRVIRGGSWDEIVDGLQPSVRMGVGSEFRSRFVGFRVAARKRAK